MLQQEALSLLKMGKNVFLTGAAGSGKTYVLNQYIRYLKQHHVGVAKTASTGIAATHLLGSTIHTWSGIGVKDQLTPMDLEKLAKNSRVKRNYKKTKVLIIDEISMLHRHQLDLVDEVARFFLEAEQAFGGLQVILCGDFFQLPPVSSFNEDKHFAFESASWAQADFHVCYLHEQHRQGQDPLLQVLNDIRSGTAGEQTKVPLRTRYKKEPQGFTNPTKLYATNVNVDAMNHGELARLEGEENVFTMSTRGFPALVDALKKNCLAPPQLTLKIGAVVMFIKNDREGRYVNGTCGVVTRFDAIDGWPVVQTVDHKTILATPEEWVFEEHGITQATLIQVPLRLAWAMTIHKSQGMTLDAAEIDLGHAFEPGMGYVALSRVRRLDGLKLMNLNDMALKVHPKILAHDAVFVRCSNAVNEQLHAMTPEVMQQCQEETLNRRFEAQHEKNTPRARKKKSSVSSLPTHEITLQHLKETPSIARVATQRDLSLGAIVTHIEKLHGLKMLDMPLLLALKTEIPPEAFEEIQAQLQHSVDGKLKPIYEALSGKYPYTLLQMVRVLMFDSV